MHLADAETDTSLDMHVCVCMGSTDMYKHLVDAEADTADRADAAGLEQKQS